MRRGRGPDYMTRGNPSRMAVEANASFVAGATGVKTPLQVAGDERAATGLAEPPTAMPSEPRISEADSAVQLVVEYERRWWGRYMDGHVPERPGAVLGERARRHGQRPGWPDYTMHIPAGVTNNADPVLAALELKALHDAPARTIRIGSPEPEWWLQFAVDGAEQHTRWMIGRRKTEPARYGLRWSQAAKLLQLDGCGYRTKVAYGHVAALEWLHEVAEGWR